MNETGICLMDETKASTSICFKASPCFVECSAEQGGSVSRVLLMLLSASSPFFSPVYQTDTQSGTNWHGL